MGALTAPYVWLCFVLLLYGGPARLGLLLLVGWLGFGVGVVLAFPSYWRQYEDFYGVGAMFASLYKLSPTQHQLALVLCAAALVLSAFVLPVELALWSLRQLRYVPPAASHAAAQNQSGAGE